MSTKSVGNITSSSWLARCVHISSQVERNLDGKRQPWDSCRTPFRALSGSTIPFTFGPEHSEGKEELQRGCDTRFMMAATSGGESLEVNGSRGTSSVRAEIELNVSELIVFAEIIEKTLT